MKLIYINPDNLDDSIVVPDGMFLWPIVFSDEEIDTYNLIYNHEKLYSFLGVQLKSYQVGVYS